MKTLIFILLLIPLASYSQKNALYFSFQPNDKGIGLRYERLFHNMGPYTSLTWGNYRYVDGSSIKDHLRVTAGVVKYIQSKSNQYFYNSFAAGFSYSKFGTITKRYIDIPDRALKELSFDIGTGVRIRHFNLIILYDFFKNESAINIGINF
jgi:hypothetical protein